jgi:hypothetical protein
MDEVDDVMDVIDNVADILVEETVCPIDTVYVPVEPADPVNCAVIIVYCETPVPEINCPTANVPLEMAVTVIVDPLIDAVNPTKVIVGCAGAVAAGVPGQLRAPNDCCCSSIDQIPAATVAVVRFCGPMMPPLPLRIKK